tara:strand:- start:80 stop:427 length:348 start_codon:yes stop_codon:yes gene_type:complete
METNVIPDNVEIHAGAKDTVAICNGCGASYELSASDYPQNKNGCFEHGEYYDHKCTECNKTIRLCTEVRSESEHEAKVLDDAINQAAKILGVPRAKLKVFVDTDKELSSEVSHAS